MLPSAIVKGVCVVADAFLIHNGVTEYIAAITDLCTKRVRKDFQQQMSGVHCIATLGFDFLWFWKAVDPDRLNSGLLKNSPRIAFCCWQYFGGNKGVVIDRDSHIPSSWDCCR